MNGTGGEHIYFGLCMLKRRFSLAKGVEKRMSVWFSGVSTVPPHLSKKTERKQ